MTGSDNWSLTTSAYHSASNSFHATGPSSKNDDVLVSPAIAIPAGSTGLRLTFWQAYIFQSNRDGGVLEFSLDNGVSWFDVTATGSGAAFATGAYGSTISSSSSPINGRKAWSGSASTWAQVAVDLTDSAKYAGKSLKIRWRLATNTGTASSTGWYVDDFSITGAVPSANLAPTIVSTAAASPATVSALTTDLSVTASDDAGESALTYTWSATGGSVQRPVNFSANGTNAAKSTTATFTVAGAYTFTVTARDADGLSATSTVDVTVNQNPTTLAITPASVTVSKDTSQLFQAVVNDQFGDALLTQPPVSWATSGGGTIDANGLLTATTVGGPFTVSATSGALNNTASLTVSKGTAVVSLSALTQNYDGNPKPVNVSTSPAGLPVSVTYNSSSSVPTDVGSYSIIATVNDPNYVGSATGNLKITGETLAAWQSQSFTTTEINLGLAADNADPDGDGLTNLAEYALGLDPHVRNTLPLPTLDSNGLSLIFTRPKDLPGVTYAAESSDDLITWRPVNIELVTDGPIQTMRVNDPLTTGNPTRRFVRLKFTR